MSWTAKEPVEAIARRFRIIGRAPRLLHAIQVAVQVAPTDVPVLIVGESGSGKEVFAHLIHVYSTRRDKPFLAINCGAIPEGTIDSELFGHEKGAFTSAVDTRKGLFEVANEGTLFLDEIGEMPLSTQARLLRVLETGEYYRVGSSQVRKTDVRVIGATHRHLHQLIQEGRFREDLYYRLNTITIPIPPLRERGEDILLLFDFFIEEASHKYRLPRITLKPEAEALLLEHPWPGNVRELKHFAERVLILHAGQTLDKADIERLLGPRSERLPIHQPMPTPPPETALALLTPDKSNLSLLLILQEVIHRLERLDGGIHNIQDLLNTLIQKQNAMPHLALPPAPSSEEPDQEDLSIEKAEQKLIEKALRRFHGNRKKAAQALGISERTLYRKLELYGLQHL